ncbi:MAG TPA: DUF4142 domain-containing protein [Xanthobacteraceae bacterium]|jgi:putative membrane protein|nr:DUF4142 domain-containing protein [Xanthobacteraceae bacterium]
MVNKIVFVLGVAAMIATAPDAFAQDRKAQRFLSEAIQDNYAEAQMGHLAQQKSQNNDVKSFGEMLVTDHNAANQKALEAAKSMNMTAPNGPNRKQRAEYNRMSRLPGSQFDQTFARKMMTEHSQDIKEYQRAARMNDAAGDYAKEALPTLRKHLQAAQSLGR